MHEKYGRDGLAVVAVDLDDPQDETTRKKGISFLREKRATFTNFGVAMGEEAEQWLSKLKLGNGIPCTDLYDRDGRLVERYEGSGRHDEIEKKVKELLKK